MISNFPTSTSKPSSVSSLSPSTGIEIPEASVCESKSEDSAKQTYVWMHDREPRRVNSYDFEIKRRLNQYYGQAIARIRDPAELYLEMPLEKQLALLRKHKLDAKDFFVYPHVEKGVETGVVPLYLRKSEPCADCGLPINVFFPRWTIFRPDRLLAAIVCCACFGRLPDSEMGSCQYPGMLDPGLICGTDREDAAAFWGDVQCLALSGIPYQTKLSAKESKNVKARLDDLDEIDEPGLSACDPILLDWFSPEMRRLTLTLDVPPSFYPLYPVTMAPTRAGNRHQQFWRAIRFAVRHSMPVHTDLGEKTVLRNVHPPPDASKAEILLTTWLAVPDVFFPAEDDPK